MAKNAKTVYDRLTTRALEYFGDDEQRFFITVKGKRGAAREYNLYQDPHWGARRLAAQTYAHTHREAARAFNAMARAVW